MQPPPLVDPLGRAITYLRVSVTDRCLERKEREPERLNAVAADIGFAKL